MNVAKVTKELKRKYPEKNIVFNTPQHTTEIICETVPGKDYSEAIAVVDSIRPHYHQELTETYEILKGELTHYIDNEKRVLTRGGVVTIPPHSIHWAIGHETWLKVTSTPGWRPEDHILVMGEKEISRDEYDK